MIKTSILNMLFQKYLRFETGLLNTSNSSELPLRVIIFFQRTYEPYFISTYPGNWGAKQS